MKDLTPRLIEPIGHSQPINSVAFSPKGDLILTGSVDLTAKLWTLNGQEVLTFEHEKIVTSVDFSKNNQHILTSSYGNKVRIWDISTGENIETLEPEEYATAIFSAKFSSTGKMVVSGDSEGHISLWTIDEEGKKDGAVKTFKNVHSKRINAIAFSRNSKKIASASSDHNAIIIDLNSESQKILPHDDVVKGISFSHDNRKVVTACADGTISIWSVKSGRRMHHIKAHKQAVNSIEFSKNNKIVSGSSDHTVAVWTWSAAQKKYTKRNMKGLHGSPVQATTFSTDEKTILSGSTDRTAILWNVKTKKKISECKGYSKALLDAVFSPDGMEIVVGSSNPFAYLWDLEHGEINPVLLADPETQESKKEVRAVTYTADGSKIITGSDDNIISIWDTKQRSKNDNDLKTSSDVLSAAIANDDSFLVAGTKSNSKNIYVWDPLESGDPKHLSGHDKAVLSVAISPDNTRFISASADHKIIVWDREKKKLIKELADHDDRVRKVVFSPDGKYFATGSSDKTVIIWDAKTLEKKTTFEEHTSDVYDLAFSPDSTTILSGSKDKKAILWDLEGNQIHEFTGHKLTVSAVHFSPTQGYAVTGSHDCTLKFWNIEDGTEIASLAQVNENDWVVTTPSGLFDASSGAMKRLHYAVGHEVIELDQLKGRYWQPGLLKTLLHFSEHELKDVQDFKEVPLYPNVTSLSINRNKLWVNIEERNGGIGRVSLRINNKERELDINTARGTEFSVRLNNYKNYFANGKNTISIRCWNEEGWLPGPYHTIDYKYKKKAVDTEAEGGALHALFIGTSKYRNEALSLKFPDQDATYLHDAVKFVGEHLFPSNTHHQLLTTDSKSPEHFPSKENIRKSFQEIADKSKPEDIVVIYFSGHGANFDDGQKAQYYYLTHEILSSNLSDSAVRKKATISSEELTEWINHIPAKKQVLIFDTCYSGKITESLKSKSAIESTRERAIERMKDRTGTYVLTGSAADRVSYEASKYSQGLLTYSLLFGMRGPALVQRPNQEEKTVDVLSLFSHAREQVEALSKEFSVIQRPTLRVPHNAESFDIGIAPEDTRIQIRLKTPKPIFVQSIFMNSDSFIDDLDLSLSLDQYLTGKIGIGNRPQGVFINIPTFPGSHQVRGIYTKIEDGFRLEAKVYKDHTLLDDFVVEGSRMNDIVPKIARNVERIAFKAEEHEILNEKELELDEKGRIDDLEELIDKPGYGYNEEFIGKDFKVPLPTLNSSQMQDIAKSNSDKEILHYQYYSVIQSKSRKFPFFSACNLHGREFRQVDRFKGSFIKDSRLDRELQWDDDFYKYSKFEDKDGNVTSYTDIFDRGHMTKREDTQWGKDDAEAFNGNKYTFFFTNALPQHSHLNGVVWRGLESYILDGATDGKKAEGDDVYKINIITGPVFQEDDPRVDLEIKKKPDSKIINKEIQLPVLFWKVVYFKKKSDDKLYCIGFMMGQKTLLEEAFSHLGLVAKDGDEEKSEPFLNYQDKEVYQVKVSFIAEKTGLTFHEAIDPLEGEEGGRQITEVIKAKGISDDPDGLSYELDGLAF